VPFAVTTDEYQTPVVMLLLADPAPPEPTAKMGAKGKTTKDTFSSFR